jgi:hypothetical protein
MDLWGVVVLVGVGRGSLRNGMQMKEGERGWARGNSRPHNEEKEIWIIGEGAGS